MKDNKPVAFIQLHNNKMVLKADTLYFEMMNLGYYGAKCGHDYFYWKLSNNPISFPAPASDICQRSCILLPLLNGEGIPNNTQTDVCVYTAIADDYTELDDKGVFVKTTLNINDF